MEFRHYSVMLKETIRELCIRPEGIYVDGTLGGGGHALEVCRRLSGQGHFYGIDQDADAVAAAGERLSGFGGLVTIIRSNYCSMRTGFCWIWACRLISWMRPAEASLTGRTLLWTCGWTRGRSGPPEIL